MYIFSKGGGGGGVRVLVNECFFFRSLSFILHCVILYLLCLYLCFNRISTIIHPPVPSAP